MADSTAIQKIRIKYRRRVEAKLQAYQLGALFAMRGPVSNSSALAAIDAATMASIGRALTGLAVAQCNRPWTDRDQARRDTLKRQALIIAAEYGLTIEANGDPRGYVLRLHGPDLPRNGWGDGFGVA